MACVMRVQASSKSACTFDHSTELSRQRVLRRQAAATSRSDYTYSQLESMRVIYTATKSYTPFGKTTFDHCKYKNCYVKDYVPYTWFENVDLVIFGVIMAPHEIPDYVPWQQRKEHIWIAFGMESPGYPQNQWISFMVDGKFNATMTYWSDSTPYFPCSRYLPFPRIK